MDDCWIQSIAISNVIGKKIVFPFNILMSFSMIEIQSANINISGKPQASFGLSQTTFV